MKAGRWCCRIPTLMACEILLISVILARASRMSLHVHFHLMLLACSGLTRHANFRRTWTAAITLFRVATGDDWSNVFYGTMIKVGQQLLRS